MVEDPRIESLWNKVNAVEYDFPCEPHPFQNQPRKSVEVVGPEVQVIPHLRRQNPSEGQEEILEEAYRFSHSPCVGIARTDRLASSVSHTERSDVLPVNEWMAEKQELGSSLPEIRFEFLSRACGVDVGDNRYIHCGEWKVVTHRDFSKLPRLDRFSGVIVLTLGSNGFLPAFYAVEEL